jgi:hypothetical protein
MIGRVAPDKVQENIGLLAVKSTQYGVRLQAEVQQFLPEI